jgi:hypothetical protein
VKPQGKVVQFMAPTVCMCSTMQRIDPQHLAWTLENLADGKVVNQIKVPAHEAELARSRWKGCSRYPETHTRSGGHGAADLHLQHPQGLLAVQPPHDGA